MFWKFFFLVFLAELGDKTQLLLVALSSKYRTAHIVTGVGSAILLLNLMAVSVGFMAGEFLPVAAIKLVAGLAFLAFAYTFLTESKAEAARVWRSKYGPAVTVLGTFFLAELGDKTQVSVITLSAGTPPGALIWVFLGASFGLFAADMLGLATGLLLRFKMPERFFGALSFLLFSVFGMLTLYEAFYRLFRQSAVSAGILLLPVVLLFAMICLKKIARLSNLRKRKIKGRRPYETNPAGK